MANHWQPRSAGADFDEWMNWDGNEGKPRQQQLRPLQPTPTGSTLLPISPASTSNPESFARNVEYTPHTASRPHDLPTPTNSSSSPELQNSQYMRLSGDTLRGDTAFLHTSHSLKRKAPDKDSFEDCFQPVAGRPTGSKRPHNIIEKRYRANLNVKIELLRDSVPSLRALKKAKDRTEHGVSSDDDDREGPTPSGKLNKASILTKAVEYIKHLEFRTRRLEEENRALRQQLESLHKSVSRSGEMLASNTDATSARSAEIQPTSTTADGEEKKEPQSPVRGMIKLPDSLKRLRESQPQEHYGQVYASREGGSRVGGKWAQRIALGSLAGLMVVEGFTESDQGSDSQRKALFGIPLEILDGWTFLRSPRVYLTTFAQYCRAGGVVPMIKGFMAISILAFLIFAYMFNSKPAPARQKIVESKAQPTLARPASPIQVRRRAWSTSMQTLGLPHHSFFPEWFAVTSEWINYTIRYWLGPRAALWLCGVSPEAEVARIKTWDIAIDAQLAGGDLELTRSRAVLTIIGAGTLPKTSLRLMMKAIHCRIVLWNVGARDSLSSRIATFFATYTANRQWRQARLLHEQLPAHDSDRLPGYLNYLLQMDCDEVFSDKVTQRAFNLMYDRPTFEYSEDSLLDVIVEDYAIRSPLDAVAAWRSTCALQDALLVALQTPEATDLLREHIQAALEIAPPGSAAETRALAIHAVLSPGRRRVFYYKAADAITSTSVAQTNDVSAESVPYFIDSSTPQSARPEIATCLACAAIMLKLEHDQDVSMAIDMFCNMQWPDSGSSPPGSTLLSIAPLFFTMSKLLKVADATSVSHNRFSSIPRCLQMARQLHAQMLNTSLHYDKQTQTHFTKAFASALEALSMNFDLYGSASSRRHSNASHDTGYVTQEDDTEAPTIKRVSLLAEPQTQSVEVLLY